MLTYSNPRMEAVIDGWPSGSKRVTATFRVETTSRGQRGTRTTTGAPKVLTYADKVRIVDGSDGKTYIIEYSRMYDFVSVMRSNMQHQEETIWPRDDRFAAVRALFDAG